VDPTGRLRMAAIEKPFWPSDWSVLAGMRLGRQYLSDPDLSISRIAWLLGYGEVSAFTHAFKRRTGKTPRDTRQTRALTR
jgi:AraC-like DNA-binding protein